jgi:hypothetical protein
MTMVPRPTRFRCLADGRVVRLATRDALPWTYGDHIAVTVTPLDAGPAAEFEAMLAGVVDRAAGRGAPAARRGGDGAGGADVAGAGLSEAVQ